MNAIEGEILKPEKSRKTKRSKAYFNLAPIRLYMLFRVPNWMWSISLVEASAIIISTQNFPNRYNALFAATYRCATDLIQQVYYFPY